MTVFAQRPLSQHVHPFTGWQAVMEENAAHGIHINERTAVARWAGEPMDYGLAVEVLFQQEAYAAPLKVGRVCLS